MSRVLAHTFPVEIAGYEALYASYNIAVSAAVVQAAAKEGVIGAFLLDLPNWDEVAVALELVDAAGVVLPKPIPFTEAAAEVLPRVLAFYLASQIGLNAAVTDYLTQTMGKGLKRT